LPFGCHNYRVISAYDVCVLGNHTV
jgi:hypothetical protein